MASGLNIIFNVLVKAPNIVDSATAGREFIVNSLLFYSLDGLPEPKGPKDKLKKLNLLFLALN